MLEERFNRTSRCNSVVILQTLPHVIFKETYHTDASEKKSLVFNQDEKLIDINWLIKVNKSWLLND